MFSAYFLWKGDLDNAFDDDAFTTAPYIVNLFCGRVIEKSMQRSAVQC